MSDEEGTLCGVCNLPIPITETAFYPPEGKPSHGRCGIIEVLAPHKWDGSQWTCLRCGHVSEGDPCDCKCPHGVGA